MKKNENQRRTVRATKRSADIKVHGRETEEQRDATKPKVDILELYTLREKHRTGDISGAAGTEFDLSPDELR